ncbi:MAG TPA: hypothetical protein VNC50_13040 [Planctomycetia bacterium]|nr:hypothetical protein [Planctomycetia bacterium]
MLATLVLLVAFAQDAKSDPIQVDVAKARKAFETTAAKQKAELLKAVDTAIERKIKTGDLSVVEDLKKERAGLAEEGVPPTSSALARPVGQYERAMKNARAAFDAALNRAIKAYVKASETDKAKPLQDELDRLRAESGGAQIALKSLVPTDGLQLFPGQKGMELKTPKGAERGKARTAQQFSPPFAIAARAATDGTNIRLFYGSGCIILNWELNKSELRVQDPASGQISGVKDKGAVTPNELHDIVWEIHLDKMRLLVDGVERYQQTGNYGSLKGEIMIGPAHGSTVTLQSLSIRALPKGQKGK